MRDLVDEYYSTCDDTTIYSQGTVHCACKFKKTLHSDQVLPVFEIIDECGYHATQRRKLTEGIVSRIYDATTVGRYYPEDAKNGDWFVIEVSFGWIIAYFKDGKYHDTDTDKPIELPIFKWGKLP